MCAILAAGALSTTWGLLPGPPSVAGRGAGSADVGGRLAATLAMVQPGNGPSGGMPPGSRDQAVSADGRWAAFASDADDLVAGDTNETRDLFLRDLAAGSTIRIPWLDGVQHGAQHGAQLPSELEAGEPAIDAHGEIVAFTVQRIAPATSAVNPDLKFPLIAVYDRATGSTTPAAGGEQQFAVGTQPSISGDGRYLAYTSGTGTGPRVVVLLDRDSGAASVISSGAAASGQDSSVSGDGRFVAFAAPAAAATAPAANPAGTQVYRLDRTSGGLSRISAGPAGIEADGASFSPSISADGSSVAFASTATNLVDAGGLDGTSQVYVWEQSSGRVRMVSSDRNGSGGRGASLAPSISGSGRFVAFQSAAPDLQPVDALAESAAGVGMAPDATRLARRTTAVFVRDIINGQLARASVDADGRYTPGDSGRPSISGDGMVVVYDSTSAALVPGDTNSARDVFFRVWSPKASVAPDQLDLGSVVVGGPSGAGVVAVLGAGWAPYQVVSMAVVDSVAGEFELSKDGCSNADLFFRDSCAVEITFSPTELGTRSATLAIEDTAPGSPHLVRLVGAGVSSPTTPAGSEVPSVSPSAPGIPGGGAVPGGPPMLVLDPPLGPPGFVTTAIGSGFPSGARVSLRWDQGINAAGSIIIVGGDGTFRVSVLVFPKSAAGPRSLVASSSGGTSFADTPAAFLVVTGSAQPAASGAVRFISPEVHPIIIR